MAEPGFETPAGQGHFPRQHAPELDPDAPAALSPPPTPPLLGVGCELPAAASVLSTPGSPHPTCKWRCFSKVAVHTCARASDVWVRNSASPGSSPFVHSPGRSLPPRLPPCAKCSAHSSQSQPRSGDLLASVYYCSRQAAYSQILYFTTVFFSVNGPFFRCDIKRPNSELSIGIIGAIGGHTKRLNCGWEMPLLHA